MHPRSGVLSQMAMGSLCTSEGTYISVYMPDTIASERFSFQLGYITCVLL